MTKSIASFNERMILVMMRKYVGILMIAGALLSCASNDSSIPPLFSPIDVSSPWVVSTPEAENIGDLSFIKGQAEASLRITSVTVVRNGRMVYEDFFKGFKKDSLHDVRSVTKSVVSLLTGLALEKAFIQSLDDPIEKYLTADEFKLTEIQKTITIRHLLNMSGGFEWNETNGNAYNEWALSKRPIEFLLEKPIVNNPGSVFNYNSAAVHLLGVIIAEAADMPLPVFANQFLFSKLGISSVAWEQADQNDVNGGSGIRLMPEDMARIGQLILQKGFSGGDQIVDETWIASITSPAFDWRRQYGVLSNYVYGGLWWVHDAELKAIFAWGYAGQFIYIVPEKNLVIVVTTNWIQSSSVGAPFATEQEAFRLIINGILPKVR